MDRCNLRFIVKFLDGKHPDLSFLRFYDERRYGSFTQFLIEERNKLKETFAPYETEIVAEVE